MSLSGPDARIPDDLLSSAYTMQATVESWLGDEYLGEVLGRDAAGAGLALAHGPARRRGE